MKNKYQHMSFHLIKVLAMDLTKIKSSCLVRPHTSLYFSKVCGFILYLQLCMVQRFLEIKKSMQENMC
jgi:hypothetical protein